MLLVGADLLEVSVARVLVVVVAYKADCNKLEGPSTAHCHCIVFGFHEAGHVFVCGRIDLHYHEVGADDS